MDRLDETDLSILRTLQNNSNLTTKELAARVHLSTTPVFERLRRLQNDGYIKKYIAILDAEKLHYGFMVFCQVKMKQVNAKIAKDFAEAIGAMPEVAECYNTSGEFDFLLKIHVTDMTVYRNFGLNRLGTIESLASLQSIFVMDELKHEYGVPI